MNKKAFLWPIFLALALATGLWAGHVLTPNAKGAAWASENTKYGKIKDIIDILDQKYVDSLDGDRLFEQSISDMLHKLDPHSNYIPASEVKAATEMIQGKFGGIGVRFSIIRDTVCLTNILANSPSKKVGIKAGDKIIAVEGENITGESINNERVMKLLKGQENTAVNVTLLRGKKKLKKKIVRGVIPIKTVVCATMLDRRCGYLRLNQFSEQSAFEFNHAAMKLRQEGMTKMIVDLRNNGGGVLQAACNIVDEFLGNEIPIVTTRGLHSKEVIYRATSKGVLEDIEVVVLINSNSASASEIVAGALQDNDRATIMGRRSFGKGLVQEPIVLKDRSNLRLTVARYYTPTGRCIQKPYTKNYEDYYEDQINRFENGELYALDSTLLVDSLKFKTPKGKIVYGGGGIMPDVFIPLDTNGTSWYLNDLRYTPAFQNFAFDYLKYKRSKWSNLKSFKQDFNVNEQLLNRFTKYAEKHFGITKNEKGLKHSKSLIKEHIKAEIARQLWAEQGYYGVIVEDDRDVQKALSYLRK